MGGLKNAYHFAECIRATNSVAELSRLIEDVIRELGFRYFALGHHGDLTADGRRDAFVIHNYPAAWAEYFETNRLYEYDPVIRVSERSSLGFLWSTIPRITEFTSRDKDFLISAKEQGVADGFTVPFRVPGELPGSFSFATPLREDVSGEALILAQLVGSFAFDAARRIHQADMPRLDSAPRQDSGVKLTERQRECLILAARGKSDWEIAKILGINVETASLHLKMARDRYGVGKRVPLAIRALYDGQISFGEVL